MQVELIEGSGSYDNPHVLKKAAAGDFIFTIDGRVSYPSGYLELNAYTGNDAAPYKSWAMYRYTWLIFREHDSANTTYPIYAKVTRQESVGGTTVRIYYAVDWLVTYYNMYVQDASYDANNLGQPFTRCKLAAANNPKLVDQWAYYSYPVTGKKIVTPTAGEPLGRFSVDSAFLLVMKCQNLGAQTAHYGPQAAFLLTYGEVSHILGVFAAGDDPTNHIYPSVMLSAIQGIYYLPGVTFTKVESGGVWTYNHNLSGLTLKEEDATIPWIDEQHNPTYLTIFNSDHNTPVPLTQIDYDDDAACKVTFNHKLTLTVNDMFDIYYKKYTMFIPYIGYIDVPTTKLFGFAQTDPWTSQSVDLSMSYYFDIFGANLTFRWDHNGHIDQHAWTQLPSIPLILSASGIGMYQTDAKAEMGLINAGIGVLGNAAHGNIAGMLNQGINAFGAVHNREIAQNVNAATAYNTVDASGMTGTAHVYFYLFEDALERKDTAANVIDHHGGPSKYDMVPNNISYSCKLWLEPNDMELITSFGNVSFITSHLDEIREEIARLEYVEVVT